MDSGHLATDPIYLDVVRYTGGDICAKINNAYTTLAGTQGGVLDARGFPSGSVQPCSTNPFNAAGSPNSFVLLLGNYTIQISVPWVTPVVPHLIIGTGTTSDGNAFGTIIQACNHSSGCSGATFPNGTTQLNFAFPHGPFPSGTYSAMIIGGAFGSAGVEWTQPAFGEELRDISIDCNDVANFAYLTAQEQERSGFNHVQAQSCTSAGGFWDKLQSQQQGTSHFSIRNYTYKSNTVPTCTTPGLGPPTGTPCYAAVIDLSGMNMTFGPGTGSCSIYPTAYPVLSNTANAIGGANITYAGSGCVAGITCTINSRQNAITTTATCTAAIVGGQLTSVSISGGGMGYDSGMMGYSGPDAVEEVTAVGTSAPAYITGEFGSVGQVIPRSAMCIVNGRRGIALQLGAACR
jgi:hypothetical protein